MTGELADGMEQAGRDSLFCFHPLIWAVTLTMKGLFPMAGFAPVRVELRFAHSHSMLGFKQHCNYETAHNGSF